MAKRSPSASKKARFQVYEKENRFGKNKKAKLQKHLKNHPQDGQAKTALGSIPTKPSRSTHTPSGENRYRFITEKVFVGGKWENKVVGKVKIDRLYAQTTRMVKQASKVKGIMDERDEAFKIITASNAKITMHEHYKRLDKDMYDKLKKEGKEIPERLKYLEKQDKPKNKTQARKAKYKKPKAK